MSPTWNYKKGLIWPSLCSKKKRKRKRKMEGTEGMFKKEVHLRRAAAWGQNSDNESSLHSWEVSDSLKPQRGGSHPELLQRLWSSMKTRLKIPLCRMWTVWHLPPLALVLVKLQSRLTLQVDTGSVWGENGQPCTGRSQNIKADPKQQTSF